MVTTTIKLRGYASYSGDATVTLEVSKPVAVVYGPNGAGKSTIAKVVRNHTEGTPSGACSLHVDGLTEPEFFIYDADYVEDNFQSKAAPGIRGIFTLGQKNAEELTAIAAAEADQNNAEQAIARCTQTLETLSHQDATANIQARDAVWRIKLDFEKGPLKFCLADHKLLADKSRLLTHLREVPKADGTHLLEDLIYGASEIDEDNPTRKADLPMPVLSHFDLERHPLLTATIAPSGDSRLAPLIAKLQCGTWVREGMNYYHGADNPCPFCQQAVPTDFDGHLAKLFDRVYQEQLQELDALLQEYRTAHKAFVANLAEAPFLDVYATEDHLLQKLASDVQLRLLDNIDRLEHKYANPAESVELPSSGPAIDAWMKQVAEVQTRITAYNQRIANLADTKRDLNRRFWEKMKHDYGADLARYDDQLQAASQTRSQTELDLATARQRQNTAQESLRELRKSSTNIEAAIENINRRIRNIGIKGFSIEKDAESLGYYHIARGPKGKASYRSLSEGEKTLMTFLYFIESLEGSHESDGGADKSRRIVIIDDPISSLSHNHIYDIASLISTLLIEPKVYPHIIVLTHSLFFFHELSKQVPQSAAKKYQCFRISKDEYSSVTPIEFKDITNDYEAYWGVLRDAIASGTNQVTLPIAMRYILEHYFSFIGDHDGLWKCLHQLGEEEVEFRPFYRFINRQSHADAFNISDLPAVQPTVYLEKFRRVFELTEQLRHFAQMMGPHLTAASAASAGVDA